MEDQDSTLRRQQISSTPSSKLDHRILASEISSPHQGFTPWAGPGGNLLFFCLEFSYADGHLACSLNPLWFLVHCHLLRLFLATLPKGLQSLCIHAPALHFSHSIITSHITFYICLWVCCSLPHKKNISSMKKATWFSALSPTPVILPDTL